MTTSLKFLRRKELGEKGWNERSKNPTLQRTSNRNSNLCSGKKELHGHSPNFHIHVSASDLYNPRSTDTWMWKSGLRPLQRDLRCWHFNTIEFLREKTLIILNYDCQCCQIILYFLLRGNLLLKHPIWKCRFKSTFIPEDSIHHLFEGSLPAA